MRANDPSAPCCLPVLPFPHARDPASVAFDSFEILLRSSCDTLESMTVAPHRVQSAVLDGTTFR